MEGSEGPIMASIIPVLNEKKYIGACLDSLINQSLDSSSHIVIVLDGGSTDNTKEIISKQKEALK